MVGEREDLSQAVNSAAADQESGHIELINKVRGGLLLFVLFYSRIRICFGSAALLILCVSVRSF